MGISAVILPPFGPSRRIGSDGVLLINKDEELGGFVTMRVPKNGEGEVIAELEYKGKYREYLFSQVTTSPDGRFYQIKIPVSEITRYADPGVEHKIVISEGGDRKHSFKVIVAYSSIPGESKRLPVPAEQFYAGVFKRINNTGVINSLLVIMPDKDPLPPNQDSSPSAQGFSPKKTVDPVGDQYYSGRHGAITVFSSPESGWTLISKDPRKGANSLFSQHIYEKRIFPKDFTGAMRTEFEKLPMEIQQRMNSEGVHCHLTVKYYVDTTKGYKAMLKDLGADQYSVVMTLGHRLRNIRDIAYDQPADRGKKKDAPVAIFNNNCTGAYSADMAAWYNYNVFTTVGTIDSLNPGAELNRDFLNSILTGNSNPEALKQILANTYLEVDPSFGANRRKNLFGESLTPNNNPRGDDDLDGLENWEDPEAGPNMYTFIPDKDNPNTGTILVRTINGELKIPVYEPSASTIANALPYREYKKAGLAGKAK